MPPHNPARRLSLFVAAVTGGVMGAMIVEIMLAHRGVAFTDALYGAMGGGGRMYAALAWWAVTGAAFVASFAIAAVMSQISNRSWRHVRSLGWIAAAALVLVLASVGDLAPLSAPGGAARHAIATFTAMLAAMTMAWFGALFAVRG